MNGVSVITRTIVSTASVSEQFVASGTVERGDWKFFSQFFASGGSFQTEFFGKEPNLWPAATGSVTRKRQPGCARAVWRGARAPDAAHPPPGVSPGAVAPMAAWARLGAGCAGG